MGLNFKGMQGVGKAVASERFAKSKSSPVTSPITQKSKSSPLKMNDSLVSGARASSKKFVDVASEVGKAFEDKKGAEPKAADLSPDKQDDMFDVGELEIKI